MAWIRLDDQFATHPKLVTVGPVAAWLWACGLSYAARYLTDGFIPTKALDCLGASDEEYEIPMKMARRLEAVGLWDPVEGGWQIHDYLDYQPSRDEVEEQREQRREAGKIGGRTAGRGRPKANDRRPAYPAPIKTGVNGQANISPVPVPVPVPEEKEKARARATCSHAPPCATAFICAERRKLDNARAVTV